MSLPRQFFVAVLALTGCVPAFASTASSTSISATPNPVYLKETVRLSATVTGSGGTPTGTVEFIYNGASIGSATLQSGTASFTAGTSGLPVGGYVVFAQYLGDANYAGSESAKVQINVKQTPTTTSLTTTTPIVTAPAYASLSATVKRTTDSLYPTGTVQFSYSGGVIGSARLNASGVATISAPTRGVPAGSYKVTAQYLGDASDLSSTSSATTVQLTGTTTLSVSVDPLTNRHAISPLVYGTNFPPDAAYIYNTNQTFTRWAGDASSGYNWQTGETNLADDYYFMDFPFSGSGSDSGTFYESSQNFISGVVAQGGTPAFAIPMMNFAAAGNGQGSLYSFSVAKYGTQCATATPYHPDAGDGEETNCSTHVTGNDTADAYVPLLDSPGNNDPAGSLYRSQWIAALAPLFGSGLHIYGIDNEPEIWGGVHWDVHPNNTSYAEMLNLFLTKPALIRQYDPQATILGIGSCGWYFYWNSETGSDKSTHAGIDYDPWLINEIYWNDIANNTRTFDWYDLHAYPDGNTSGYTKSQLQALALRLPRDFWDPTYQGEGGDIDQQYVTQLQPNKTYPFRIPRMRALINYEYPGTPFSLSEWNVQQAGETDFSTALADVDVWGILGRERVQAASRWTASVTTSPAYNSLLLYRNYDGQRHTFGTTSVSATNSGNPDFFSSYAALSADGSQLTLMLINKDPANYDQVSVNLGAFSPSSVMTYTLTQNNPNTITSAGPVAATGNVVSLPPYTAELFVMSGKLQQTPAAEWDLNPDTTMCPAKSTCTLAPRLISGSGTVTLSNPQSDAGITVSVPATQITSTQPAQVSVVAGSTPGFYHYTVDGMDSAGVKQTQGGYILVQNPAASINKIGDGQTAAAGSTITLTAQLVPGQSGGSQTGASIFFTTSAGTLSAREATTASNGEASVTLTLPTTPGPVSITAEGQYALGHPTAVFTATAQ